MSDPEVATLLTRLLCANGGRLPLGDIPQHLALSPTQICTVLVEEQSRFIVLEPGQDGVDEALVLPISTIRVCSLYLRQENPCQACDQLHLCRYFILGKCRRHCRLSHDIHSEYNRSVLKANQICGLNEEELRVLLLQNDPLFLPEICFKYKGSEQVESCKNGDACSRLHICQFFSKGQCRFFKCKRSHNLLDPIAVRLLQVRGLSMEVIQNIQLLCDYRNRETCRKWTEKGPSKRKEQPKHKVPTQNKEQEKKQDPKQNDEQEKKDAPMQDKEEEKGSVQHKEQEKDILKAPPCTSPPKPTVAEKTESSKEICLFHVWKFCKNAEKCPQMHYYLPYRWQILGETVWTDLPRMEEIEKDYCDPNNTSSGIHNIDFEKMTCAFIPVRRLSTVSSVTKPEKFQLTTEWLWYWKNEYGQWIEYGKQSGNHRVASLTSFGLENVYLADKKAIVPFQAGSQSYEINFADMVQKNLVYLTKREICRRPKFLSYEDVLKIKMSKSDDPQLTSPSKTFPPNWDKAALPEVGYKMVAISSTSSEFRGIQKLFENTMSGYSIQKMKRIQNPSLWKFYQGQKEHMKKLNGGKEVNEKLLFHGTSGSHMDAICHSNFDWRICGVNGTMYGKGSYFARDASYSHNYCQSSTSTKSMFVARVLVGDFTRGDAKYVRPPNKSFSSNSFYDSCVDKVSDPSIFVIFEKHQIYPEYILEYVEDKKCCIS